MIPGMAPAMRKTRILYHGIHSASKLEPPFSAPGQKRVHAPGNSSDTISLDAPEVQARMADAKIVFIHGWRIRAPESVRRQADTSGNISGQLPRLEQAGRQPVERLRQKAEVVVGVHVRLGDNWKWHGGKYSFPFRIT